MIKSAVSGCHKESHMPRRFPSSIRYLLSSLPRAVHPIRRRAEGDQAHRVPGLSRAKMLRARQRLGDARLLRRTSVNLDLGVFVKRALGAALRIKPDITSLRAFAIN